MGVTAGASAPEELVQQVVARLREWGGMPADGARGARGARGVFAAARACAATQSRDVAKIAVECPAFLSPAVGASIFAHSLDRGPPAVLVHAQFRATGIGRFPSRAIARACAM